MSAQFIDKAGRPVKPGDIIVYGHALGRCAALQYGKALALKTPTRKRWGASEVSLSVQGVTSGGSLLGKGTLQFGDRTLIVTRDQVPAQALETLDKVRIPGPCEICGSEESDVKWRVDPFSKAVVGLLRERDLCNRCYKMREDEV